MKKKKGGKCQGANILLPNEKHLKRKTSIGRNKVFNIVRNLTKYANIK